MRLYTGNTNNALEINVAKKIGNIANRKEKLWLLVAREEDISETVLLFTKKDMLKLKKYIDSQLKK